MPPPEHDDLSSLEEARERLYAPGKQPPVAQPSFIQGLRELPHRWQGSLPILPSIRPAKKHVRFATLFLAGSFVFFLLALGIGGYFIYYGGNSVSVNNVTIELQGPTTIAGGDTVPLALAITNRNSVALDNATIEIDFPTGTRSADNVLNPYPRYTENLGTIPSGATVTRAVKAVVFGGAGDSLSLPVALSFGATGSNAVFVKKSSYSLSISSTPLSISADALAETVSGAPLTITLSVRSNATVPLNNVVVAASLPFGFTPTSASLPLTSSAFELGTLAPGASKSITLIGTLSGNQGDQRVFHFTVGTSDSAADTALAVTYMTQDATVAITAPFINTALSINGQPLASAVLTPAAHQTISLSYANTLTTAVSDTVVSVVLSGNAIDYSSVDTTNGFYQSATHTVVFSKDTDPALATLAPGASGLGSFTFVTLPASAVAGAPQATFTTSVSGTREGEANVPEVVTASQSQTVSVATAVTLSAAAFHSSGPFADSGSVPPVANQPTAYTIRWALANQGSAVAGPVVSATLPSYVAYTGETSGSGGVSYDTASRSVTWSPGDLSQGASAQAYFQVILTPSASQRGSAPPLTSAVSFTGHDRYANVDITASANPATTETTGDPGYVSADADVQ